MGRKKEEKAWRFGKIYLLGFPNSEVKKSLYETILPVLTSEAEQQRWRGCSHGADERQAVCRAIQGWHA